MRSPSLWGVRAWGSRVVVGRAAHSRHLVRVAFRMGEGRSFSAPVFRAWRFRSTFSGARELFCICRVSMEAQATSLVITGKPASSKSLSIGSYGFCKVPADLDASLDPMLDLVLRGVV